MADPFVAEIRIFPFNFAPRGWAWCNGQLLPLSQNTALFSLLGTTYGGNGQTNFALPNMQGNAPMHPGQGPGLSLHDLGETGGSATVTLTQAEMAQHSHTLRAYTGDAADSRIPNPNETLGTPAPGNLYNPSASGATPMNGQAYSLTGNGQPHNNMMPYVTYYFNIALQGVYPPRS
jgi:microcystin-dependent protein